MSQKVVVWIEDREHDLRSQLAEVRKKYQVERVAMPQDILDALKTNHEQLVAIVVDIMLFAIKDLRDFQIRGVSTDAGLEAGWAIIEHVLRTEESLYREIPILVLSGRERNSEQERRINYIRSKKGGEIEYVEKHSLGWEKKLVSWLHKVADTQQLKGKKNA